MGCFTSTQSPYEREELLTPFEDRETHVSSRPHASARAKHRGDEGPNSSFRMLEAYPSSLGNHTRIRRDRKGVSQSLALVQQAPIGPTKDYPETGREIKPQSIKVSQMEGARPSSQQRSKKAISLKPVPMPSSYMRTTSLSSASSLKKEGEKTTKTSRLDAKDEADSFSKVSKTAISLSSKDFGKDEQFQEKKVAAVGSASPVKYSSFLGPAEEKHFAAKTTAPRESSQDKMASLKPSNARLPLKVQPSSEKLTGRNTRGDHLGGRLKGEKVSGQPFHASASPSQSGRKGTSKPIIKKNFKGSFQQHYR